MAKVGCYNHTGRGKLQSGPHPPFYCPWASEGCPWHTSDKTEHQQHIWNVHEKPGMIERGIHITLAGHEEDEKGVFPWMEKQ